jgi:riboflavin transporter FmnP
MRSALISQQKERHSDARRLALTAVLASVAALLSLSSLSIPFPLLPFLRFDLAEVPDILSFMLLGPSGGMTVTLIHWMLLNLHSSFDPIIGPTMKFMAVFATMLGLYVGTFFVKASFSKKRVYASLLFSGTVLRFIIMIPPTFLLYYLISPTKYLPFAVQSLSEFGIHVSGILAAALLVTIITGIYNITHALLTITLVWLIYSAADRMGVINSGVNWLKSRLNG